MKPIYTLLLLSIACLIGGNAWGQLSITNAGTTYTQDFNTLSQTGTVGAGTANAQSGGIFSLGWSFLESSTNADQKYSAGTGSSSTGETYSFGVAGVNSVNDRTLGILQSGNLSSIIGFQFTNNTGTTVTSITIGYTGEVWRLSSSADNLAFSYQLANVALNASTGWIPIAGLNFTTPSVGTANPVDGNAAANRTVITPVTITGLSIPNGTTVTMRWVDGTAASSAGMGIDDFSILLGNSLLTPPTLTAATGATVDNPFTITFTDDPTWRGAITSIKVNGSTLPTAAYSTTTAGQIIFYPANSAYIQSSGAKNITIVAGGYNNDLVSQTIGSGAPTALSITTQPAAPAASGGALSTSPIINAIDQYGNNSSGYTINAAVSTGQTSSWSLGGTTNVTTNSSGNATFSTLTATNNTAGPYNANITFSYGSSVSVMSNPYFTIPAVAPTVTPAAGATVDNPFSVTFTDNATWRGAITSITVGGTALPVSAYSTTTAGQIIFTPSASTLLQSPGSKNIVIIATNYNNISISQPIAAGVPYTLIVTQQPKAPTTYTGLLTQQPKVSAKDQYGNTVTGSYTITASVSSGEVGSWTLGGTVGQALSGGVVTYAGLTATNLTATAFTATITFSYNSVFVVSNSFIIPAPPPPNDACSNAITLTPASTPTGYTGTLVSASPTIGLSTDTAENDVWYKFNPPCTGIDSIAVNFTSSAGRNFDFEVFASGCPSSGVGILTSTSNNPSYEVRKASYTSGTAYYIRVIDDGSKADTFNIKVYTLPPVRPTSISGNAIPCLGSSETYSVAPIIAGVTYVWTLPGPDWIGPLTSSSINVVAGSSSGNITVTPTDSCGQTGPTQTLAVAPITAPLNVTGVTVNPSNGKVSIAWANPPNCFDEIMIVATDNSSNVTLVPTGDGSQYIDTTEFASQNKNNSQNMNTGEYCIYKGTATATVMTGLLNGNPYNLTIFTRWGTQWSSGVQVSGIKPAAAFTGAYKSIKNGTWTDYTTWNRYDGATNTWVATTGVTDFPNSYLSDVSIEPNTVVQLNSSPMAVRNLEVKPNAQLWTSVQDATNKYITIFGDITCDGIIGNANANTLDYISFNIEGPSCLISGAGTFGCSRMRKEFTAGATGGTNNTTLNINKDINLFWKGTALYNDASNDTTAYTRFNVNLNSPYKLTLKDANGSVAIDGAAGADFSSRAGGKFTINGTLTIPRVLYLTTDNSTAGPACSFEIGTTGKVYTNILKADASGSATHSLIMKSGSYLSIADAVGFSNFSQINNLTTLSSGSTIEYSANASQYVLSGISYQNLTVSGSGTKAISNAYSGITVNGTLTINPGLTFAIGAKTLTLNGTIAGTGTISGSSTSIISIGPNNTLTSTPLGVLKFTPGSDSLGTLTMDRMMKTDNYPNHKYWAAVLGSTLNVGTLNLNQGILATDKYLLTLLNYTSNTYSALNTASYIATTDTLATAFSVGNTFNGSYGFRINGVKANSDTYFPVGADFISPNRAYVKLDAAAATRNLTIVLTKGDIIRTGSPRVNRIWYMYSSVNDSVNAAMRLYYKGYDLASYPYITKQDELETGFLGLRVRLVEKANMSDTYFTNISNGADTMVNYSPGTEVYAKYTRSVSTIYNGTKPGIYKFNVFSIVDGDNVVLPVIFTSVKAYQHYAGISINWSVANESGISYYEVERAADGRLYNTIAAQTAQNSGSTGISYTAADGQPLAGANYYRIKAVGKSGELLYSMVVSITLNSDGKASLLVSPNPVNNNQCNIQLSNLAAGKYNISVYGMDGKLIASKQIAHAGGSSSQKLYLPAGTSAGVYVVKLTGNNVNMQTNVFVSSK